MKTLKKNMLILGLMAAAVSACTDNYESLPVDQYTIEYVFSETDSAGVQAVRFLNAIYSTLPNGYNRVGNDFLDAATDDAVSLYMDSDPDVLRLQTGRYTASNQVTADMNWGTWYQSIRKCNIFINHIDRVAFRTRQRPVSCALSSTSSCWSVTAECRWWATRCSTSTTTWSCRATHLQSVSITS